MPGIPGKSKGCTTCRRRKVLVSSKQMSPNIENQRKSQCDLRVPSCAWCIKSGIICEGYQRFPVFLNRTAQGLDKRQRLDEAKSIVPPSLEKHDIPVNDWRQMLGAMHNSEDNRMLCQPSATPAFHSQIVALFFHRYLPANEGVQDGYEGGWLRQTICLQNPGEALHLALKAISMTTLGRLHKDDRLAFQGGTCYGSALHQLRKALQSEVTVGRNETLTASFILALYELFESESPIASMQAWDRHMSGLEKLVLVRGPQLCQLPFGQEMLEYIRFSLMLSCLENRRTSVLAQGPWVARPWDESPRGPRLYDKCFALATLLQELDSANLASVDTSILTLSNCVQRIVHMDTELEEWYDEFTSTRFPSYWPTPPATSTGSHRQIGGSGPRGLPLLCYPNLTVASITVTFWALKLIISKEIATICQIILVTNRKARANSRATDPAASLMLTSMAQRAKDKHSEEQRMNLVTDIARSMPYCLNHTMGLLGPERAFFALRTALVTIRRNPGPEREWFRAQYRMMDNKKCFVGRCSSIQTCMGLPGSKDL